jgi:hypothetical protein
MSKKTKKAKAKRGKDHAPVYRPAKPSSSAFPCVRCGSDIGTPAGQDQHNMDAHLSPTTTQE